MDLEKIASVEDPCKIGTDVEQSCFVVLGADHEGSVLTKVGTVSD